MFTEPARAKNSAEVIPLSQGDFSPNSALHSHWLLAAYGTTFRHRNLKRSEVVLDLRAW